jgi:hypothetical protein
MIRSKRASNITDCDSVMLRYQWPCTVIVTMQRRNQCNISKHPMASLNGSAR